MPKTISEGLPSGVSFPAVKSLLDDTRQREQLLLTVTRRFEEKYNQPLAALETRLAQGEGQEHPDWEDSIEWRNAEESLQRTRLKSQK